jgi:hypothetical protein
MRLLNFGGVLTHLSSLQCPRAVDISSSSTSSLRVEMSRTPITTSTTTAGTIGHPVTRQAHRPLQVLLNLSTQKTVALMISLRALRTQSIRSLETICTTRVQAIAPTRHQNRTSTPTKATSLWAKMGQKTTIIIGAQ